MVLLGLIYALSNMTWGMKGRNEYKKVNKLQIMPVTSSDKPL